MDDDGKTNAQLRDDIAALRQQLAVQRAAQLDAESVIATVRAPLVVLTADLRVISANQAFYQTFQVTPRKTIDYRLYDVGNGQWDIPALHHVLEALLPLGLSVSDFAVTHQFPSVGQKVMRLNARRIDHGHTPSRILLAIEDVTEREQAARLLQQRSDWFSVTLTSIGDAVLTTDPLAAITFMNPEAERLTGWAIQEALGRPVTDVVVLHDADTQQALDHPVCRVLQEGLVVRLATHAVLVRRDGRAIPIADSGAPIRGADGTLQGAVMVFRDVTTQANLERSLVREKAVAEAADQAKGELLATMSHELRTPLGVIAGYTDLLREGEFGAVTDEARRILGRVRQSALAVLELITALLDLRRLEAGRLPVYRQDVKIPTLFEELKRDTRESCEPARLDVVWQAEDALPAVHTDRGKLKIILTNLLGNALKFTAQGRITVRAQRRDAGVEFCVTDTGIGIPRDALAVIFEPFRQVTGEGGGSQQGTGLGLHIVQRLVALLGGAVTVESEIGNGSTFRVWLPSGETSSLPIAPAR